MYAPFLCYSITGQHFFISGDDGWYAAISDPMVPVNLRMETLTKSDNEQYWLGASVQHFGEDGQLLHSALLETVDPTTHTVSCESVGATAPCVANGAMTVDIDGERKSAPGLYDLGEGYSVAVANLPTECKARSKTYESTHGHELKNPSHHDRRLTDQGFKEYITDRVLLDADRCKDYIAKASEQINGGLHALASLSAGPDA